MAKKTEGAKSVTPKKTTQSRKTSTSSRSKLAQSKLDAKKNEDVIVQEQPKPEEVAQPKVNAFERPDPMGIMGAQLPDTEESLDEQVLEEQTPIVDTKEENINKLHPSAPGYSSEKKEDLDQKPILFVINGFVVREDSSYEITGKFDGLAPRALVERNSSKMLLPWIADYFSYPYDERTKLFNTGLYSASACYNGMNPEEKRIEFNRRLKNIRDPWEEKYGQGTLDHLNPDSVVAMNDGYLPVKMGKLYYTGNLEERVDLYFLLLGNKIAPKEHESNPMYSNAMYCVEDKSSVVDVSVLRASNRADAIFNLRNLMDSDYTKLIYILNYIGIFIRSQQDKRVVNMRVMEWIEDRKNVENADYFNGICRQADNRTYYEIYMIYYVLQKRLIEGKIAQTPYGYMFLETNIGVDLKSAAANIQRDKEFIGIRNYCLQNAEIA